jgi:hypothetical protein
MLEIRHRPPPAFVAVPIRILAGLLARYSGNPGVVVAAKADWHEVLDYVQDQAEKNFEFMKIENALSAKDLVTAISEQDGFGAKAQYHQLPCLNYTVDKRVQILSQLVAKNEPVLLIGDDDGVSPALAQAGFSKITVLDIDDDVLDLLRARTSKFGASVRLEKGDAYELDERHTGKYAAVMIDPPCTGEGLRCFIDSAHKAIDCAHASPVLLLTTNLHSLMREGRKDFFRNIAERSLEITEVHKGVSVYPVPPLRRQLLNACSTIVGFSLLGRIGVARRLFPMKYFISDMYILKVGSANVGRIMHHP